MGSKLLSSLMTLTVMIQADCADQGSQLIILYIDYWEAQSVLVKSEPFILVNDVHSVVLTYRSLIGSIDLFEDGRWASELQSVHVRSTVCFTCFLSIPRRGLVPIKGCVEVCQSGLLVTHFWHV
jgi:hypothetical protein